VGEAYDKVAAILGLGYPGGPVIDRLAQGGDAGAVRFPRSLLGRDSLDFSFSGLKTALVYKVRELGADGTRARLNDLAASFEQAVVRSLMLKVEQALDSTGAERLAIGGGVAANTLLRREVTDLCRAKGLDLKIPPPELCTDNAAMIGSAARFLEPVPYPGFLAFDAFARSAA
jgi:N6-L-threonylcarbamoyladenine synthase